MSEDFDLVHNIIYYIYTNKISNLGIFVRHALRGLSELGCSPQYQVNSRARQFLNCVTLHARTFPRLPLYIMSAINVPPDRPPNEPQTVTEEIVEGQVDTTETNMRYLAYANRLRTIALASSRYLAYTSGPPSLLNTNSRRRRSLPQRHKSVGCTWRIRYFLGLRPYRRWLRSLQSQIPQP
jgi:hypothetical protein